MLAGRAIVSFLVLPGVVAGLVPWLIVSDDPGAGDGWLWPGVVVAALGLTVLLWSVPRWVPRFRR